MEQLLLLELDSGLLTEEEYLLLSQPNKPIKQNPVYPYWLYEKFSLQNWNDDECWVDFRFHKEDLMNLKNILLPEQSYTHQSSGIVFDSMEALCLLLRRLAFPCRYSDLIPRFGRSVPDLCQIFNTALNEIYEKFHHLFSSFDQEWLSPVNLKSYADKIHAKGAPLDNCWGFIDGTLRQIPRPSVNQKCAYSGHKRHHGYKMQSISAPNGLIASLFGPIEGSRHDSYVLSQSGIMDLLQQHSRAPDGKVLCIYGDTAYPLREYLQTGFKNVINVDQDNFNTRMSAVRVSVEWVFGDVIERFKHTDFHKMQKIGVSAVAKQYVVSALLSNIRTCMYGSTTSSYFDCQPPSMESYLAG